MGAFFVWLQFLISAALVIFGGSLLARNGKKLAERCGLTEIWIGFIFLAAVTSVPELATSLGAVLLANAPNLALGDILGSNAFNLFIVAILNVYAARRPITAGLSLAHFRFLFVLILLMTGIALVSMALKAQAAGIRLGHTDLAAWIIIILYLAGSWKLFRIEHPRDEVPPNRQVKNRVEISFYFQLIFSVLLVIGGGFWLALTGRDIAGLTGWGQSFVGALFLALVTSLPEVAVCLAAVKIGAYKMALGNILGSNIFNLSIIFWTDLAYRSGSLLAQASPSEYATGALGIILLAVVALALKLKPARFGKFLSWDTILIVLIYLGGMYLIFRLSVI